MMSFGFTKYIFPLRNNPVCIPCIFKRCLNQSPTILVTSSGPPNGKWHSPPLWKNPERFCMAGSQRQAHNCSELWHRLQASLQQDDKTTNRRLHQQAVAFESSMRQLDLFEPSPYNGRTRIRQHQPNHLLLASVRLRSQPPVHER
jgi:hypothetical protein